MIRYAWLWAAVVLVACESAPPAATDASTDRGADALLPTDAAPARCNSDRECSAAGLVCDTAMARCVECNAAADCGGERVCVASRCITPMRCTTARMCPGQVCNVTLGYCVDCNTDVDCTGGQLCRGSVCVAPPRRCSSSRECSDMAQVCDTARSQCVDCTSDTDCPMDRYCAATSVCVPRVCTPNANECVSATRMRRCDARGTMQTESDCAAGQTCRGGSCQMAVCSPGQMSCDMTGARRRCNDDGGDYTAMPCAGGEACRDGACVMRACAPGTATCASATERRVCAADGLSTMVVACGAGEGCRDGVCAMRTCVPGAATCMSTTVRSVCNADGFGTTPTPCGATQRCTGGACMDLACAPGSSSCVDARTVRVCNADGTAAMNLTCPTGSTCSGTMCSGWVCTPGTATCPSGATARTVCNADGLATRSEACTAPVNATMARCGAGDACTFTCNTGFGDCNMVAADGCEVALATTAAHCGACGTACAARANTTVGCTAGACDYRCNAGFGDCDGNATNGCEAALTTTTNCGRCGGACEAGLACSGGACRAATTFRIDSLSTAMSLCRAIDHADLSGDDRGGIAVSASQVFYTGDTATVRASLTDLSGLAGVGTQHDALLSDLASNEVYVMLNSSGTELSYFAPTFPFTVTQLGILNGTTGALSPTRIPLSAPLAMRGGAGIFSGRGRAYVFNPGASEGAATWLQIGLPSGTVTTLRAMAPTPMHAICENWAFWGVAEFFDGEPYAAYVEGGARIVRYRIRDGLVSPIATMVAFPAESFADMCSFTFSPSQSRWYFHYEANGFTGGFGILSEVLGSCPGTFSTP